MSSEPQETMTQVPEKVLADFKESAEILRPYRNRYAGRRCFVIGNGPSLRAEDLDKIKEHDDLSIASNRIHLIFDRTEWRPTVYTCSDECFFKEPKSFEDISSIKAELKLLPVVLGNTMYPVRGAIPIRREFNNNNWIYMGKMPPFSDDITSCVYNGRTITYINLQIAAFLGFKEIILLGVDHQYAKQQYIPDDIKNYDWVRNPRNIQEGTPLTPVVRETEGVVSHFAANYMEGIDAAGYVPEATSLAYQSARKYAEAHGIRIVNATRGGKLNVFKRVPFDSLFRKPRES